VVVLVGDDGSEGAASAVAWASSFAAERSLKLVVVGVGDPGDTDDPPEAERITLPAGHPASEIMQTAADVEADLVVLGQRGAGGFPSMPIGTTAHVIAGSCGRPVAVVPTGFRPRREPLVGRVVVGLDGLRGSALALEWAASAFPDAHFSLVHALEAGPSLTWAGGDDAKDVELTRGARSAQMHEWCSVLHEVGASYDTVIEAGGVAEVLLDTARDRDADAVVVGRHDHGALRGTLGGVSQRVLAYAPCPAVVMPSRW
jgi:nucleotide-binding universal stress UspA family protein